MSPMIKLQTSNDVLTYLSKNLNKQIAQHVTLFPEAAQALIDINSAKRPLRNKKVELFARAMLDGRWLLVNNGIAITTDGDFADGNHRAHAVVMSQIPSEFYLHTGLSPKTTQVIDTGTKRTLADTLSVSGFEGHGSRTTIGAAIRLLHVYDHYPEMLKTMKKGSGSGYDITHDVFVEYADTLDKNKLYRADSMAQALQRINKGYNRSALVAAFYLFLNKDPYMAEAFFVNLQIGDNLHSGDPALVLRNSVSRWGGFRAGWHMLLYIKAWNATRSHKILQTIRLRTDEKAPIVK